MSHGLTIVSTQLDPIIYIYLLNAESGNLVKIEQGRTLTPTHTHKRTAKFALFDTINFR